MLVDGLENGLNAEFDDLRNFFKAELAENNI